MGKKTSKVCTEVDTNKIAEGLWSKFADVSDGFDTTMDYKGFLLSVEELMNLKQEPVKISKCNHPPKKLIFANSQGMECACGYKIAYV